MNDLKKCHHDLNIKNYLVGFVLCLVFTLFPFSLVKMQIMPRYLLIIFCTACALVQFFIQLKYFLHLSFRKDKWDRLISFVFTIIILIVIVFGSIWIIHDLNYFMMDPLMDPSHPQNKE